MLPTTTQLKAKSSSHCELRQAKAVSYFLLYQTLTPLSDIVFKIVTTPGPGSYKPIDGLNDDGTYALSGHTRTKTPKMRKASTPSLMDRNRPGPGWYDHN